MKRSPGAPIRSCDMHVLEYLHRNVKIIAMPMAMVVGALLCRPITAVETLTGHMITPVSYTHLTLPTILLV